MSDQNTSTPEVSVRSSLPEEEGDQGGETSVVHVPQDQAEKPVATVAMEVAYQEENQIVVVVEEVNLNQQETFFALWKVALPAAGSGLFMLLPALITTAFIGHRLGHQALSEYGVANTTFNVFGFSLGIGLVAALDTFVSQAYGRDPKSAEIGILLQRSLCVVSMLAIPVLIFFWCSEPIVGYLFSPTLAPGAYQYLGNAHFYFIAVLWNASTMSCINACRQTQIPLIANIINTVSSVVLSYYFLDSLKTTVYILAVNQVLGVAVMFYFIHTRTELEGIRSAAWWPPSAIPVKDVISAEHFKKYMSVGVPAMIAVCSEWWAFETVMVIAAHVNDEAVGVMSVVISIFTLCAMFAVGMSRGASIVVGNAVGAKKKVLAKGSLRAAMMTMFGIGLCTGSAVYKFGPQLWRLFTADVAILKHATPTLCFWMGVSSIFDGMCATMQGGYRGVGKQKEAAQRVLCSLWLVGVGSAYFFAIRLDWKVEGIIYGIMLGLMVEAPLLAYQIHQWNWDSLVQAAADRAEPQNGDEGKKEKEVVKEEPETPEDKTSAPIPVPAEGAEDGKEQPVENEIGGHVP